METRFGDYFRVPRNTKTRYYVVPVTFKQPIFVYGFRKSVPNWFKYVPFICNLYIFWKRALRATKRCAFWKIEFKKNQFFEMGVPLK
jgi:hypothetical protein